MTIRLISIEPGKNKNHLIFTGYVPTLSSNGKYSFDFIGTELTTTASLLDEQTERLRQALLSDFGYAPYTFSDAQKIFEKHNLYYI